MTLPDRIRNLPEKSHDQFEKFRDMLRDNVLAELDRIMNETFGVTSHNDPGATDQDLPDLFASLDQHAATLFLRFESNIVENIDDE